MTSIVFAHKYDIEGERRIVLNFPRIKKVIKLIKQIEGVKYDEVNDIWHIPSTYKLKALNEKFSPELFFTWDVYQPSVLIKKYSESDKLIVKLPSGIEFDFRELGFEEATEDKKLGIWIIKGIDNLRTLENVLVSLGTTPVVKQSSPFEELEELEEIQKFTEILKQQNLSQYVQNAYIFHIKQFVTYFGHENLSDITPQSINQYIQETISNYNISPLQKVYLTGAIKILYQDVLKKEDGQLIIYKTFSSILELDTIKDLLEKVESNEEKMLIVLRYLLGIDEYTLEFTNKQQLYNTIRDLKEKQPLEEYYVNLYNQLEDKNFISLIPQDELKEKYAQILEKYKAEILYKTEFDFALEKLNLKNSSRKSYSSIFKSIIRDFGYTHPLHWSEKFLEDKLKEIQENKNLTNETIVQYYNTIKIFYEKNLGRQVPKIKLPERKADDKKQKEQVYYSNEKIIKIFNSSENLKHFTILFLTTFTGIKTNVVIEIAMHDLDLDKNTIYILSKDEKVPYLISDNMKLVLQKYIEKYKPAVFLFEGYKGTYSPSGLRKILKITAENAGIKEPITYKTLTRSIIKNTGGTNTYLEKKKGQIFTYDDKVAGFEKEVLEKTNWEELD